MKKEMDNLKKYNENLKLDYTCAEEDSTKFNNQYEFTQFHI